jgi:hypothetical protein
MVSHISAGGGRSSPKLRRIYCLGYAQFISLVEFHAHANHHSCYAKTLVLGTLWMSCECTPISLIARAAMPLMKFSKRLPPTLTVRPFLSFARYVPLTFISLRQLLRRPSWTCTFQDPPAASIIFTPTHDFYDPYRGDFNQFGWINHRGIWSSHCDPQ